ncbi:hypothetical protein Hanom_Chr14g01290171 [Helianthus anomalus]
MSESSLISGINPPKLPPKPPPLDLAPNADPTPLISPKLVQSVKNADPTPSISPTPLISTMSESSTTFSGLQLWLV